jgi:hypothetical protein
MAIARTSQINIRLAPDDYRRIEAKAHAAGVTCAEFVRPVVLRACAPDPVETIVVAEAWSTKSLFLVLIAMLANGEPITDATIERELAATNALKLAEARHLLKQTTEVR